MIKQILGILIIFLAVLCPVSVALDYNLTYDNNGNLLQNANQRYEYDGFNQLSKVYNSNGTLLEEYTYGSEGNRIKKVEHLPNNQLRTTYYVSQNLVRVVNSSGTFDTYYYYDNQGTLLSRKDPDGKKYYYHPDHLGSNTLITNEQGNVVAETSYLPFGEVWEGGNDRFLYTGKEKDGSGLMYYGARYYDPVLKRFTQPDTIIPDLYNPQSLNRYSYVMNNPYKYTDPSGKFFFLPLLLGVGVALTATAAYTSPYWMPYVSAFFTEQNINTIKTAKENPAPGNVAWAALATYDLATPGISETGMAKKGFSLLDKYGDVKELKQSSKFLKTGDGGKTVTVNSFEKADDLLYGTFPDYKKVAGNSPVPKSTERVSNIKSQEDLFKKANQGYYKKDYQYSSKDTIHSGSHGGTPHINIHTDDGRKLTIAIDKTK